MMQEGHKWLTGIAALIGAVCLLFATLYLINKNADLSVETPWGGTVKVQVPRSTTDQTSPPSGSGKGTLPELPQAPSLVGVWKGYVTFKYPNGTRGPLLVGINFFPDGTYAVTYLGRGQPARFDPGTWAQEGFYVAWTSSSRTMYRGKIEGSQLRGNLANPNGTFILTRQN